MPSWNSGTRGTPSTSRYQYLEDSGIRLPTKRDSPHLISSESRKPPKIQGKRAHIRGSSRPISLLGPEARQTALPFPSPQYDPHNSYLSYLDQCFIVLDSIGQGGFGDVYKVQSRDDSQLYAVKKSREKIPTCGPKRNQFLKESNYQHKLSQHPNIVKIYQAWEEGAFVYLQMELCSESLLDYSIRVHDVDEHMIRKVLIEVCSALKYIHDNDCIHLDVKCANIMLTADGVCKLGDFGLISNVHDNPMDFDEGDSKYAASELFSRRFTTAADIFSLGISILEISCDLILPGNGEAWHELRSPKIPKQFPTKVSAQIVQIIQSMMVPDFTSRPSAQEIIDELNKPEVNIIEPMPEKAIVSSSYSPFAVIYDAVFARLCEFWDAVRRLFSKDNCQLPEMNHNGLPSTPLRQLPIRRRIKFPTSDDSDSE